MTGRSYAGVQRQYLMALGLSALTGLFFTLMTAYVPVGAQLLANPGFTQDLTSWQRGGHLKGISSRSGALTLSNSSPRQNSSVYQCFERQGFPDRVLARVEARTASLVLGEKPWSGARGGLLLRDADGTAHYPLINRLVNLREPQPWTSFESVMSIPSTIQQVCFRMTLLSTQGVFQLKNPTLHAAQVRPSFCIGWWVLLLAWLASAWLWSRQLQRRYLVPGQTLWVWAMLALMALGILMPNDMKTHLLGFVATWLPETHGQEQARAASSLGQWLPMLVPGYWDLSKLSHLIGFFLLSILLFHRRRAPAGILISGMLVAAVCSEALQFFAPGRTPRFSDLLVDSLGILGGWGISKGIGAIRRAWKQP
ncbi:MAG: VanZ family protein [Candidatus Thiodiazotropha sp.]